jgi:hypothetical protein
MFVGIIDLFFAREVAGSKSRVLLAFWQAIFGGLFTHPKPQESSPR